MTISWMNCSSVMVSVAFSPDDIWQYKGKLLGGNDSNIDKEKKESFEKHGVEAKSGKNTVKTKSLILLTYPFYLRQIWRSSPYLSSQSMMLKSILWQLKMKESVKKAKTKTRQTATMGMASPYLLPN